MTHGVDGGVNSRCIHMVDREGGGGRVYTGWIQNIHR